MNKLSKTATVLSGLCLLVACNKGTKLSHKVNGEFSLKSQKNVGSNQYWIDHTVEFDFKSIPQKAKIKAKLLFLETTKSIGGPQVQWELSSRFPHSLLKVEEKLSENEIDYTISGPRYEISQYLNQATLVASYKKNNQVIVTNIQPKVGYSSRGLLLWLDAQDKSTVFSDSNCTLIAKQDGDNVSCWVDKKNQFKAIQPSLAASPRIANQGLHRLRAINFDGDDDFLKGRVSGFLSHHTPHTIAIVLIEKKQAKTQHIARVGWDSISTANKEFRLTSVLNRGRSELVYGFSSNDIHYKGIKQNKPTMIIAHYNGGEASPKNKTVQINGEIVKHSEVSGRLKGSNLQLEKENVFSLGSFAYQNVSVNPWQGNIGEILIYNRRLKSDEIELLQEYFRAKWNF